MKSVEDEMYVGKCFFVTWRIVSNIDKGTDTTSCTQDYSRSLDDDGVKDW